MGRQLLKNKKGKPIYNHFEGLKCGHYHVSETKDKKSVDCPACLKVINHSYLVVIGKQPVKEVESPVPNHSQKGQ
jgi:hypothetical protein